MAGMEDVLPTAFNFLDTFYGSINTNAEGTLITHERFDDVVNVNAYDNTFNTPVTIGADGHITTATLTRISPALMERR